LPLFSGRFYVLAVIDNNFSTFGSYPVDTHGPASSAPKTTRWVLIVQCFVIPWFLCVPPGLRRPAARAVDAMYLSLDSGQSVLL
jgi:hypothetical protein